MLAKKTSRLLLGLLAGAALAAPGAARAAEQSFTTTGERPFVVPLGVTSLQVSLVGGSGGPGSPGSTNQAEGGPGATVRATLAVIAGETLLAQVAGDGLQNGQGGYGGGGYGGSAGASRGGGGGGASAVLRCAGCSPLVVAAGGGGGGGGGRDWTPTINGGNGGAGDLAGLDGEPDLTKHDAGGGGGGAGSQSAGGAAGAHSYGNAAKDGRPAAGGNGGTSLGGGGGGGGGGGIFGGGGGGGGDGFLDLATYQSFNGGGGGGGGGASGVPAGAAGVSGFSLLPATAGAVPSVAFTWTPRAASSEDPPAPGGTTGPTGGSPEQTAPQVSALALSRSRFRRGLRRAQHARRRAGTTVTFRLSEAARVRLTFERVARGRMADGRCRAAATAGARCTRHVRVPGAVRLAAPAGDARIRFDGVLDSGRRLAPGAYRLTLVAAGESGRRSVPRRARFTIVR